MYLGWSEGFHDAAVSIIDEKGNIVFASAQKDFLGKNTKNLFQLNVKHSLKPITVIKLNTVLSLRNLS